jgi:3(or 17)beta-hydroxysteroid dehydrogenase
MGRVSGKVALVTGGASGLGKADAIVLAREGAKVVLTDIDDAAGAEVVRHIVEDLKGDAIYLHQDVSDEQGWTDTINAVEKQYGGLNILVNNAGIVIVATPEETTLEQFRLANSIMNEGVFMGCKAALPLMKKSGAGSIINMSSTASHLGFPVFFAYSAAKGAVRSMTKSVAVYCQMNRFNIRCNSIHAGSIDTPMVAQALSELGLEPPPEDDLIGIGEPEDVANLVLFLASDESKYVNGAEHMIDNAFSIQ